MRAAGDDGREPVHLQLVAGGVEGRLGGEQVAALARLGGDRGEVGPALGDAGQQFAAQALVAVADHRRDLLAVHREDHRHGHVGAPEGDGRLDHVPGAAAEPAVLGRDEQAEQAGAAQLRQCLDGEDGVAVGPVQVLGGDGGDPGGQLGQPLGRRTGDGPGSARGPGLGLGEDLGSGHGRAHAGPASEAALMTFQSVPAVAKVASFMSSSGRATSKVSSIAKRSSMACIESSPCSRSAVPAVIS